MSYCVYKHTAPNGKTYIGITCKNPFERWKNGHGYKNNVHFWNAIVKFGWDNFKHEILFTDLTKQEACNKEIELISLNKSNNPIYGYNHSSGGECAGSGVCKSTETRLKISASLVGRKLTDKHKQNSAAAHKGLKRNEETKRKMSEKAKKRGVSEVTRQATRIPIICVDTNQIYPSINEAARRTGIARTAISNCCCNRSKTAGGFSWAYQKNIKEMR